MSAIEDKNVKGLIGFGLLGILAGAGVFFLTDPWISIFCGFAGIVWFFSGIILLITKRTCPQESPSIRARVLTLLFGVYGVAVSCLIIFIYPYLPNSAIRILLQVMTFLGPALCLTTITSPNKL